MIVADIDENSHTGIIILRPNNSWNWRANLLFLFILMAVSLSIAFGFLMAGAWVILPFSILELSVVAYCIYYCARQCSRQEVITISDFEVRIERGTRKPAAKETFQRMWAKFFVQTPRHPWDPVGLTIRSHGRESEIGSFLSRTDKRDLVSMLKRVVPV